MTPTVRIDLGASPPVMRIARPGFSADSADPGHFLFREDFLSGQVIARGTLNNPGPSGSYLASVDVGVPIETNTHIELMRGAGLVLIFPIAYDYDEDQSSIIIPNYVWTISQSVLTVNFGSGIGGVVSYIVWKI